MERSSIRVALLTAFVVTLLLALGCTSPPPEEPTAPEEAGAITTEDFESGSAGSMQPAHDHGEEEGETGDGEPSASDRQED